MGFISFAGRVSFSSSFTLAAWQRFHEFGDDGGPAVKLLEPKYALLKNYVASSLGFQVPEIEIKHLIAAKLALKGIVDCSIELFFFLMFNKPVLILFFAFFNIMALIHGPVNVSSKSDKWTTPFSPKGRGPNPHRLNPYLPIKSDEWTTLFSPKG
ncbi:hypothetical protein AMTRI_Chr04g249290 [Amborella trichopoda]